MNYFEKGLPEDRFFRIHRTAIVNVDFIDKLEPKGKETYQCLTKSGHCLSVSKTGFKKLKTRLTW
jgi:DNA-binding LytR/AlgR family response regulator